MTRPNPEARVPKAPKSVVVPNSPEMRKVQPVLLLAADNLTFKKAEKEVKKAEQEELEV